MMADTEFRTYWAIEESLEKERDSSQAEKPAKASEEDGSGCVEQRSFTAPFCLPRC